MIYFNDLVLECVADIRTRINMILESFVDGQACFLELPAKHCNSQCHLPCRLKKKRQY